MTQILKKGTPAPNFTLLDSKGKLLSLTILKGRPVVLIFYPADFSPVCSAEAVLFNEILPEFRNYNAEILGISVDGQFCHAAFAKQNHLKYPLLADFEPKGAVSKMYGVYRDSDGFSERALFVINPEGRIAWSYLSPINENPGADGVLEALESLEVQSNVPS